MLSQYWDRLDQARNTRKNPKQSQLLDKCLDLFDLLMYAKLKHSYAEIAILRELNRHLELLEFNLDLTYL